MAWETIKKERWVTFTPPEAAGIAAQFRSAAASVRTMSTDMGSLRGQLDAEWEGNAKLQFMDAFSPMPGDLGSFADWLEGKANEIASMTVRRQESYNEEVWVDDPVVT